MRARLFGSLVLAAVAMVAGISCSDSDEHSGPELPPLGTAGAASVTRETLPPAPAGTASSAPLPRAEPREHPIVEPEAIEDFFDELLVGLEDLGIGSGHAECVIGRLEDRGVDEAALKAAELDSVLLLDEESRNCLVDLLQHVERRGG